MADKIDNAAVTNPLPPETTTPMPPVLHEYYRRELGWPGRPELDPDREREPAPKPHIVLKASGLWEHFVARMKNAST